MAHEVSENRIRVPKSMQACQVLITLHKTPTDEYVHERALHEVQHQHDGESSQGRAQAREH